MTNAELQNVFYSPSQQLPIEPGSIRMIEDRVLIRDLGDEEKVGSIIIPEEYRQSKTNHPLLRIGLVVAVGPGDKFIELGVDETGERVRRKLITQECEACEGRGRHFHPRHYQFETCPWCKGTKRVALRIPAQCQIGDKVLYDRRREAEFYLSDGLRYSLVHAEQAVIAVLEED